MTGASLISLASDARVSIVSGKTCSVQCRDIYTNETFKISGKIPTATGDAKSLACEIKLNRELDLEVCWVDASKTFTYDSLHNELSEGLPTTPLLFIGHPSARSFEFGVRQRPAPFTCFGMSKLDPEYNRNFHANCRWILSDQLGYEAVITFATSNGAWARPYYRCVVDLRNIPEVESPNDGIWIEMNDHQTLRIGRFSTHIGVFSEIEQAYVRGELRAPTKFVTVKARKHKEFNFESANTDLTFDLPDLRFDDEIKAQGLESPVPF